jgi:hypothetical protein
MSEWFPISTPHTLLPHKICFPIWKPRSAAGTGTNGVN